MPIRFWYLLWKNFRLLLFLLFSFEGYGSFGVGGCSLDGFLAYGPFDVDRLILNIYLEGELVLLQQNIPAHDLIGLSKNNFCGILLAFLSNYYIARIILILSSFCIKAPYPCGIYLFCANTFAVADATSTIRIKDFIIFMMRIV